MKLFSRVRHEEKGIGLAELTVAMAVLLIGIFAVSAMLVSGVLHIRNAERSTTAGALVSNEIEKLRAYEWKSIGLKEADVATTDTDYQSHPHYKVTAGTAADQRVAVATSDLLPSQAKSGADGRTYRVDTYVFWRGVTGGRLVKEVSIVARENVPGGDILGRVTSSFDGSDPDVGPVDPPPTPSAPVIAPIGNRYSEAGDPVSFFIDADDLDGDPLTFSATGLPPGVTLDANQGDVEGTPTTQGTYTPTITVTDGTTPASTSFTWTITPTGSGPLNLALGNPANKSSSSSSDGGAAAAVDGDTDGNAAAGSVAITNYQTEPWWSVDLGSYSAIGQVVIHNRTDCCSNELGNFYVLSSATPLGTDLQANLATPGVRWFHLSTTGTVGSSVTINFNEDGRYVQIHRAGYGRLNLAEVQLFAAGT